MPKQVDDAFTWLNEGYYPTGEKGKNEPAVVWCAPAGGRRNTVPTFVLGALAHLCDLPLVTRSQLSGDGMETYFFGASTVAACAASHPKLFTMLLSSGSLAPLSYHRLEPASAPVRNASITAETNIEPASALKKTDPPLCDRIDLPEVLACVLSKAPWDELVVDSDRIIMAKRILSECGVVGKNALSAMGPSA